MENQEKQSKSEIIIEEQNEKMVYFQEKIVEIKLFLCCLS